MIAEIHFGDMMRRNIVKRLKSNYILRLYSMLGLILSATVICMSILLYQNADVVTTKEIMRLNEAVVYRMSRESGTTISDATQLCNKIAIDSQLIALLQNEAGEMVADQIDEHLTSLVTSYVWKEKNSLIEAYVVGYNGLDYAQYKQIYSLQEIQTDPDYQSVLDPSVNEIIFDTGKLEDEPSIYRYSFRIVQEIRDLITGVPCGVVIIRASENFLYSSYKELITADAQVCVVNADWTIVSAKNKQNIGMRLLTDEEIGENTLNEKGSFLVHRDDSSEIVIYSRITGTQWYLIEILDNTVAFAGLGNIRMVSILITCGVLVIVVFLAAVFKRKTEEPIQQIKDKMQLVAQGDLTVRAAIRNDDEFGKMGESFNKMVEEIDRLLENVKQKERQKRLVEMDFLQAQINPHFIYNTLSSIRFNIEIGKISAADEMIILFSRVLRKTLSRSDEFIRLDEEIDTIKNYVGLQKLRYSDTIEVDYEIDPETSSKLIPTFILQPLVENSIFHNTVYCDVIRIMIKSEIVDGLLKITVSDNGKGMTQRQIDNVLTRGMTFNKVGLSNVNDRLQLTYGIQYWLEIQSQSGNGMQVVMRIPIEQKNDAEEFGHDS